MTTDKQQQEEELLILKSILGDKITDLGNENNQFEIDVEFELTTPFYITLIDDSNQLSTSIKYLPPLILTIYFHDEYPSSNDSPTFVLSSCYLSHKNLQNMCHSLDRIWKHNISQPIVFQWIEYLKDYFSSINELCLSNKDVIKRDRVHDTNDNNDDDDDDDDDPRAISNYEPNQAPYVYGQLIDYNRHKEEEQFFHGYHECPICMSNNIPGRDMLRLYKCNHVFCRNCLHEYAQINVNMGLVEWLICPDSQCQLALLPSEVKVVVNNDELYDKYERLLLQKTLEQMQDIVWCPRCQQAVLTGNEKDNLALCNQCYFAFCKNCKKIYHSQTLCDYELELEELKKRRRKLQDKMQALNLVPEDEEKLVRELLVVARMETSTRPCPNPSCGVPIEKNMGCDHMFCTRCKTSFNWSEAQDQTSDTKILIEAYANDIDKIQKALAHERTTSDDTHNPNASKEPTITELFLKRMKKCPNKQCEKINIKSGANNYIICQYCKRSFCFACSKSIINPKLHFKAACKRFSPV